MLYRPYTGYPNDNAIDGTGAVTLTTDIQEGIMIAYQYTISENNTNTLVYQSAKITDQTVYAGHALSMPVPPNSFTNGKTLIWKVRLWEATPTMFICSGKALAGCTTTQLKIRSHPAVQSGMYLKINSQQKKISTYTDYLSIGSGTTVVYNPKTDIKVGRNMSITTAMTIKINNGGVIEQKSITSYGANTGILTVGVAFSFDVIKAMKFDILNGTETATSGVVQAINTKQDIKLNSVSYLYDGLTMVIGDEEQDIYLYDTTANWVTTALPYLSAPANGTALTVKDTTMGYAVLESALSGVPVLGDLYDVYSDFIDSVPFIFKSRTTPVVTVTQTNGTALPSVIDSRLYTFKGNYTQAEGVQIKSYKWRLYDSDNNLLDEFNGSIGSEMNYSFNGFLYNKTYGIQLIVENQDNFVATTPLYSFDIIYNAPSVYDNSSVEVLYDKNAMKINFSGVTQSEGHATGTYDLDDGMHIHADSTVYYEEINTRPMAIEAPFALFERTQLVDGFIGKIIELSSGYWIEFDGHYYKYTKDNVESIIKNVYPIGNAFVLATGTPVADTSYQWDDTEIWDDSKIWTESVPYDYPEIKICATESTVVVKEI